MTRIEQTLKVVHTYEKRRRRIRGILIAFLRAHKDKLDDTELRKVVNFPNDLSDARLARICERVQKGLE